MRAKLVLIRALWQVTFNEQKLPIRATRILNESFEWTLISKQENQVNWSKNVRR